MGGNNLSKEGSELHLQYAPALSRPWQIWNAAIPSLQSMSPRVNMRQTNQIHLFYLLKEYKGTRDTLSGSAEQVTACYVATGHDWKHLGYATTISTAKKKQCYGKAFVLRAGRFILILTFNWLHSFTKKYHSILPWIFGHVLITMDGWMDGQL